VTQIIVLILLEGGPSKLRLGGGVRRSPALHQRAINPLRFRIWLFH